MPNMMKRKGTVVSMDLPDNLNLSKRKRTPWRSSAAQKGDIDCSSPEMLIQSLLGDANVDEFVNDYWEKKPLAVHRSDPKYFGELFTLAIIKQVVKDNELDFFRDVNVGAYVGGQRKDFIEETGNVTAEAIDQLMNEKKATIQFYHPQRYIDDLWNIVQKMESYFGSLVAASAYITPAGCQGSAPHCDDVENFIFQIEGKVEWKIYKPMVELSRDFTLDLAEGTLGEPTQKVLLEPGDVLYFPRGIIYHCKTTEDSYSTHVALSTYQQNTWGDFMCHAVQQAIENALEDSVRIRSGLPINFRSFLGTGKNMAEYVTDPDKETSGEQERNLGEPRVIKFKETVQACLAELVNHIDVNKAADSMCAEFVAGRLPPYGFENICPTSTASNSEATPADLAEAAPAGDSAGDVGEAAPAGHVGEAAGHVGEAAGDVREAAGDVGEAAPAGDVGEAAPAGDVGEAAPAGDVGEAAPGGDVGEAAPAGDPGEAAPSTGTIDNTTTDLEDTLETATVFSIPSIEDKIRIKFPDHIRVVYVGEDEDDDLDVDDDSSDDSDEEDDIEDIDKNKEKSPGEDDEDEDEEVQVTDTEPHIKVLHSLCNDRFSHMGFNVFGKVGCLKFDVTYAKALVKLVNSSSFISVKDLQMDKDEDKVLLATKLAADGLLEVQ